MPILTQEERIGTQLAGKYRLDAILGEGGMGVVYRAQHTWTEREVAIKIIRPEFGTSEQMASRFLREARISGKIRHACVVEVLDMGQAEDGSLFLVLELLHGHSVGEILDAGHTFSLTQMAGVLLPIMDALAKAHQGGIIHRDLKPENIFMAENDDGTVLPKLLDFGIAKSIDAAADVFQTSAGASPGTPQYMAPEQAVPSSAPTGPPADVWAMGVVVYELLTGTPALAGESVSEVLAKLITGPPIRVGEALPELPVALTQVIDRALERDLERRFADMAAFRDALVEALRACAVAIPDEALPFVPGAEISRSLAPREMLAGRAGGDASTEPDDPPTIPDEGTSDAGGSQPSGGGVVLSNTTSVDLTKAGIRGGFSPATLIAAMVVFLLGMGVVAWRVMPMVAGSPAQAKTAPLRRAVQVAAHKPAVALTEHPATAEEHLPLVDPAAEAQVLEAEPEATDAIREPSADDVTPAAKVPSPPAIEKHTPRRRRSARPRPPAPRPPDPPPIAPSSPEVEKLPRRGTNNVLILGVD